MMDRAALGQRLRAAPVAGVDLLIGADPGVQRNPRAAQGPRAAAVVAGFAMLVRRESSIG
jgi:hypothetical protein